MLRRTPLCSEPAPGQEIEGESDVDDAPGLVNTVFDHQRRNDSDVFLDAQVDIILQGFTEIERYPLQPNVDVPDSLCDLGNAPFRCCPRQQLFSLLAAKFRVDRSVRR